MKEDKRRQRPWEGDTATNEGSGRTHTRQIKGHKARQNSRELDILTNAGRQIKGDNGRRSPTEAEAPTNTKTGTSRLKITANCKLFGKTPELAAALLPSGMTGCARFQLESTEYVLRPLASSCESLAVHPSCLKSQNELELNGYQMGHMLSKYVYVCMHGQPIIWACCWSYNPAALPANSSNTISSGFGRSDLHHTHLLDGYTSGLPELCLPLMQSSEVGKCRFASADLILRIGLKYHYRIDTTKWRATWSGKPEKALK